MTRLEKLKEADKNIQEATIPNDVGFFTFLFPKELTKFLNLTYFPEVKNEGFHFYLDTFRDGVLIETIKWCKESKLNETDWQKEYTLRRCKENIHSMMHIIIWAFEYYVGNKELLLKEEN